MSSFVDRAHLQRRKLVWRLSMRASGLRFFFVGMFFCVFFLEFFGHFAVFHYECPAIAAVSAFPDGPQLR
jgi:hypothetical protein